MDKRYIGDQRAIFWGSWWILWVDFRGVYVKTPRLVHWTPLDPTLQRRNAHQLRNWGSVHALVRLKNNEIFIKYKYQTNLSHGEYSGQTMSFYQKDDMGSNSFNYSSEKWNRTYILCTAVTSSWSILLRNTWGNVFLKACGIVLADLLSC